MFSSQSSRFSTVDVIPVHSPDDAWTFRMLSHAPIHTVARAMQMVTGGEDEWLALSESWTPLADLRRVGWGWEDAGLHVAEPAEGRYRIVVSGSEPAHVGDSAVRLLRCGQPSRRPDVAWWDEPTPVDPALLQHDFDIEFGFVPRLADPWHSGAAPLDSSLAGLFALLLPPDRVAMESHLQERGLLHPEPLRPAELSALTAAFATALDAVGEGLAQGPDGRLPARFTEELAHTLAWDRAPAAGLTDAAWRLRLLRRLQGQVLRTRRGRFADKRSRLDISTAVLEFSQRDRWYASPIPPAATLALVAVADGVGTHLSEVTSLLSAPIAALDRDCDAATEVLDRLALLSAPGAYGVITPEMRRLANHVVLRSPRTYLY
ncbi:hypothetical protein [Microbacterium paludicola]|uniref:hypothetical protein n=1 Tax=Microbacterium paludicola TaxID=300019 RepID=UPI0031D38A23